MSVLRTILKASKKEQGKGYRHFEEVLDALHFSTFNNIKILGKIPFAHLKLPEQSSFCQETEKCIVMAYLAHGHSEPANCQGPCKCRVGTIIRYFTVGIVEGS